MLHCDSLLSPPYNSITLAVKFGFYFLVFSYGHHLVEFIAISNNCYVVNRHLLKG